MACLGKSPGGVLQELTEPSLKRAPSPREHREAILYGLKSLAHFQEPSLLSSRIAGRELKPAVAVPRLGSRATLNCAELFNLFHQVTSHSTRIEITLLATVHENHDLAPMMRMDVHTPGDQIRVHPSVRLGRSISNLVVFSLDRRDCKSYLRSHGRASWRVDGSPRNNFGAQYRSGAVAMSDEKSLPNSCQMDDATRSNSEQATANSNKT